MGVSTKYSGVIARVANFLSIIASAAIILSLTAIMALFLGSESQDLLALINALAIWSLAAVVTTIGALSLMYEPGRSLIRSWWSRLSAWLCVLIAGVLILAALAQLALFLVHRISDETPADNHYVPIVALVMSCLSLAATYALGASANARHSGPIRHSGPV